MSSKKVNLCYLYNLNVIIKSSGLVKVNAEVARESHQLLEVRNGAEIHEEYNIRNSKLELWISIYQNLTISV